MVKTTEYSKKKIVQTVWLLKKLYLFIYLFVILSYEGRLSQQQYIPITISMFTYWIQRKAWKRGWIDVDVFLQRKVVW